MTARKQFRCQGVVAQTTAAIHLTSPACEIENLQVHADRGSKLQSIELIATVS